MSIFVQPYGVDPGPLLVWALIAVVCTAILVVTALVLSRSSHRAARWLLVALLLGALLNGVLAWRGWAAFLLYAQSGGCHLTPPRVCEQFSAKVAHDIATVTLLGAVAILGTAGLCLARFLVRRRSVHTASAVR